WDLETLEAHLRKEVDRRLVERAREELDTRLIAPLSESHVVGRAQLQARQHRPLRAVFAHVVLLVLRPPGRSGRQVLGPERLELDGVRTGIPRGGDELEGLRERAVVVHAGLGDDVRTIHAFPGRSHCLRGFGRVPHGLSSNSPLASQRLTYSSTVSSSRLTCLASCRMDMGRVSDGIVSMSSLNFFLRGSGLSPNATCPGST